MRPPEWLLAPLRSPTLLRAVDRMRLVGHPSGGDRHVVVAPPGGGNIGDQALVEAFVEAVEGEVIVIVRKPGDMAVPPHLAARMSLLPLPALVYGTAIGRWRDLKGLRGALSRAGSFAVMGADIMDGAYVPRASVNRALLAERVAQLGWDTRILGFSWNAAPLPAARAAVGRAASAGTVLCVRDPLSAARARSDGLDVVETADLVFSASTRDDEAPGRLVPGLSAGERLALVNASGLVGPAETGYVAVVRMLRDAGIRVAIVPHVSRPGSDDMPLCHAIAQRFAADPGVTLVPRLVSPREIRGLGARAVLTVTGRMHLAVMSLMAGTPAVTIATQGKVEGLMALFKTPDLAVAGGEGLETRLPAAVASALSNEPGLRLRIQEALPAVTSLARANVESVAGRREQVVA